MWFLLLPAATVWSFAHLPLELSDRNRSVKIQLECKCNFKMSFIFSKIGHPYKIIMLLNKQWSIQVVCLTIIIDPLMPQYLELALTKL